MRCELQRITHHSALRAALQKFEILQQRLNINVLKPGFEPVEAQQQLIQFFKLARLMQMPAYPFPGIPVRQLIGNLPPLIYQTHPPLGHRAEFEMGLQYIVDPDSAGLEIEIEQCGAIEPLYELLRIKLIQVPQCTHGN